MEIENLCHCWNCDDVLTDDDGHLTFDFEFQDEDGTMIVFLCEYCAKSLLTPIIGKQFWNRAKSCLAKRGKM